MWDPPRTILTRAPKLWSAGACPPLIPAKLASRSFFPVWFSIENLSAPQFLPNPPGTPNRLSRGTFWRGLCPDFAAARRGPAGFIHLTPARNSQPIRGHILRDRRTGGHIRAVAHAHGRDQRRIAADKNLRADGRAVLRHAVVVAGDRSRTDIRSSADRGVADVAQVLRLHPFCE